ncbi:MAG TPA: sugar ABC transporter ATP-binding protein [Devosia sp.]|nr:sugar ABC transporter ATP-binding protein [Devosia sp.]
MIALEAQGVRKAYGGVVALKGADFAVRPGSVHALLGENGAGKSTLVKIMTGAIRPDAGTLRLAGKEVSFRTTADAAAHGVAVVAQELSLFPQLDILDNLFPMREPRIGPFIDRRKMRELVIPVLQELGVARPLHTLVAELSLAERQLVEIAKALVSQPRVLLLDEPTSALETGASDRLLKILRVLRERDVGVVYVSHILEEVMSLCDEVTILRDGHVVLSSAKLSGLTMDGIVAAMLGKGEAGSAQPAPKPVRARPAVAKSAAPNSALTVSNVTSSSGLSNVSFRVEPGEIVGLAGLAGAGPEAMLAALAGLSKIGSGEIMLPGGKPRPTSLREAIARGVAYVSGDRRKLGLMLDKPIWENVVQVRTVGMARDGLFLRTQALRERAAALAARVGVRTKSVELNAGSLSGGNQQKVVLAKWLDIAPSTLLLDDPTRGVDIGAREEINLLLRKAAAGGAVVLYLSTDPEELARGCDRVLVFYRGAICAELSGDALTSQALVNLMNTGAPAAA